jgi:hypothetical protein
MPWLTQGAGINFCRVQSVKFNIKTTILAFEPLKAGFFVYATSDVYAAGFLR